MPDPFTQPESSFAERPRLAILQDRLRIGGTERQSLFLAEALSKRGFAVTLVVFRPGGKLAGLPNGKTFRTITLQPFDTGIDPFAPGLIQQLRQTDPQLILCHGKVANEYARYVMKKLPAAKVITTVRTGKKLSKAYFKSVAQSHLTITNSVWRAKDLAQNGITPERIRTIPNALLLKPDQKQANFEGEETILLQIASFQPGKRQEDLIRMSARFDSEVPWRLWLVGDGPTRNRCERLVHSSGLSYRVTFFDSREGNLSYFYDLAHIAVSPSQQDALPNFLIEAQAACLPVVARDYQGVHECASPDSSIFVSPDDDDAFVAAMNRLLADKSLRMRMGKAGQAFVRETFRPDRIVDQYLGIFAELGIRPG